MWSHLQRYAIHEHPNGFYQCIQGCHKILYNDGALNQHIKLEDDETIAGGMSFYAGMH